MLMISPVRALLYSLALLGSALLLPGTAAAAEEAPFAFVDGYILIHARIHAQPVTLLLDSGASASVLSLDAARRLRIPLGAPEGVDGVNSEATAFHIAAAPADAGSLPPMPVTLAIDLHNTAQLCSERVDGLIGADFLIGRITQIDYANHMVRLLGTAPRGGETLPLHTRNGVYCLPVCVNGSHPRWTRLDTGCNDALHWVVPRSEPAPRGRGISIGFITNTDDETLVSVGLGHITLPHVETALHGSPIFPGEAGLLGSEVLSQYLVTIDARAGRIHLAAAPGQRAAFAQ